MTEPRTPAQRALARFRANRLATISLLFLAILLAFVILYPLFAGYGPEQLSDSIFKAPSREHWMGTDAHGRDLLVRICYGARISLLVGLVGAAVSFAIGLLWGAASGYSGGRVDEGMMRFVDILYSLPSIILAIVLMITLEPVVRNWLSAIHFP